MNPTRFWLSVLTIVGVAAVAPAWLHFSTSRMSTLPPETRFLATICLPVLLLLMGAGVVDGRSG